MLPSLAWTQVWVEIFMYCRTCAASDGLRLDLFWAVQAAESVRLAKPELPGRWGLQAGAWESALCNQQIVHDVMRAHKYQNLMPCWYSQRNNTPSQLKGLPPMLAEALSMGTPPYIGCSPRTVTSQSI